MVQSTEISIIILSTILRCAAPHGLHGYPVLQILRVSDPQKHSLFIGAEHRNICSNANQPDVKKVQSTEISFIILSTILRCAAPHSLHAYSVLQMLRVSDPKNITGIRFYKCYGSLTLKTLIIYRCRAPKYL